MKILYYFIYRYIKLFSGFSLSSESNKFNMGSRTLALFVFLNFITIYFFILSFIPINKFQGEIGILITSLFAVLFFILTIRESRYKLWQDKFEKFSRAQHLAYRMWLLIYVVSTICLLVSSGYYGHYRVQERAKDTNTETLVNPL